MLICCTGNKNSTTELQKSEKKIEIITNKTKIIYKRKEKKRKKEKKNIQNKSKYS